MKNRQLIVLILLFILAGNSSCVKEFIPHVKKYDDLLVVNGAITDQPGPYTVKLSISGNVLQQSNYNPYSKCVVEISDDFGISETLTEVSEGVYKTDSLGIQGTVGRKYKIRVMTPDGEVYESLEEELKKGVNIQSVYAEQQQKKDPNLFYPRDGYQFYVDAENVLVDADANYYLWLLESTYKFKTDFPIHQYYNGIGGIKPFTPSDSLRTGYRTKQITEIYTLNSGEQAQHQALHVPLNYEDNYTKALTIRYSLKVNQYTITKSAYTFWNTLRKMNANQGSLYTQQPYQVRGNVVNVNNPKKLALGYFMAAGMAEKRTFFDPLYIDFHYPVCVPDTGSGPCSDCSFSKSDPLPIYITIDPWIGRHHVLSPECVDCRVEGFLKKPDFWVD